MIRLQKQKLPYFLILLLFLLTATAIIYRQSRPKTESIELSESNESTEIVSAETGILTIWWYQGYLDAERETLRQIVQEWEKQSRKKIKLVFFKESTLIKEIERALESGATPDIFIDRTQLVTRLAWEGKLKDVSELMQPITDSFPEPILQNAYQYNNQTKKKSYYAVPILQEGIYLHYWRDLLTQLGYSDSDIPQDWEGFWEFWLQIQKQLSTEEQKKQIFALGFPSSALSTDTFLFFEHILEAYNIEVVDSEGQLTVSNPQTRQGIINALQWWTQFYQDEYIPPSAIVWENGDNNASFYNRIVAMTANPTLSIPAGIAEDQDTYYEKLGTVAFPKKPNGEPMTYIPRVRQVLVFADRNLDDAKSFLSYLIQPEVLENYIEASGGRFFPTNKDYWNSAFWNNPDDPHISTVHRMLAQSQTRPHHFSNSPAYMEVLEANVWGRALYRILADGLSPEVAGDEAIAQIQEIFQRWE
ncbi:MAG: ABC transporter substrate-binding protein [Cyanobacteria bacterium P01_F01_bin.143]